MKFGGTISATKLDENFTLGITDPARLQRSPASTDDVHAGSSRRSI